ncbi:type IA DNA topoisomerase [Alkalicoccus halolimnae]|uniref:DNA topoisomerase n=1 Tax=Alkalicoccus halolimnae TaxID=1667239 RepID=A0A5C7FIT5_9BACI|nr:type IA DNA topoisomerase [Alkalicoccus halolimnae]TXF87237.1 DNA topoisomerase III [Alkalicoccus halolimnae]
MQLIIAEKPDQAKKLAAPFHSRHQKDHIVIDSCPHFPTGAVITWALGHLLEPVPPETYKKEWKRWELSVLPMIPEDFKYRVKRRREFSVIQRFAKDDRVKGIIHAGDAEREGEAIIRLILNEIAVYKPLHRLWISSLTPQAVKEGFAALKDGKETESLYTEAVSRAYADWLIGMNASRLYTLLMQKHHGVQDVFSVGRVQTPTLCLIVDREKKIENFKPEPYWEVEAEFTHEKGIYKGVWHDKEDSKINSRELADKIADFARNKSAELTSFKEKERKIQPPQLFSLSTLQAHANKAFKFSPKKTLDTAQKLYTKGLLTYPRTDSAHVTKEEAAAFPGMLEKLKKLSSYERYFPLPKTSLQEDKRYVNSAKVKDHYAIIPTEEIKNPESLSGDEAKIYDAVIKRMLAAHEKACIMNDLTCETTVDERALFISKTSSMLQEGWRRILPSATSENNQELGLQELEKGLRSDVTKADVLSKKTKPPKRFTEGDLIQLMKTCGKELDPELAQVMKETEGLGTEATRAGIITVLKDRGYISVTKNMVFATAKGEALFNAVAGTILSSPEMTAKWEQRLAEIGEGRKGAGAFLDQVKKLTTHLVEEAGHSSGSWNIDAAAIPSTRPAKNGKRKKRTVKAGPCPLCGADVVDKGNFYGCSAYRQNSCTFTISKTILGKKLDLKQIKLLLKDGKTETINGFNKGDETFHAVLKWDAQSRKITFVTHGQT